MTALIPDRPGPGDNIERVLVIFFLGITVVACVGGGLWLSSTGKDVPDFVNLLAASCVGALAAMLTGTSV